MLASFSKTTIILITQKIDRSECKQISNTTGKELELIRLGISRKRLKTGSKQLKYGCWSDSGLAQQFDSY